MKQSQFSVLIANLFIIATIFANGWSKLFCLVIATIWIFMAWVTLKTEVFMSSLDFKKQIIDQMYETRAIKRHRRRR